MGKISKEFDKRLPPQHLQDDAPFMEDMNAIYALQAWFESQRIDRIRGIHVALLFLGWETKDNPILRDIIERGIKECPTIGEFR